MGDIKTFTPTFWVIIVAILLTEASTATFIDNLNDLLVKRFGFSYVVSGRLCMIPYVSLTFLAIVAGKLIADNPQYRRLSYVASSVEFFFIMICLYFLPNSTQPSVLHYIVVITFNLSIGLAMGIFYSGLFTCIPFSVDDKVVGTAWGFSGMAIGLASCTVPLLYAGIVSLDEKNLPEGYLSLTLVGVIVSFLPVIHSLYMYFGPFGLLDIKYKDITRLKKEGMSLEQILREYSDREPTKNDIDKIG